MSDIVDHKISPDSHLREEKDCNSPFIIIQQALRLHQAGDLDAAEKMYREILAQSPHNADANHLIGEIHLRRGKLAEAEASITLAISLNSTNPVYHHNLGVVFEKQQKKTEAISSYTTAVELNPRMTESLNNLALLKQQTGDYQEAAQLYNAILENDPDNVSALNNLGLVYKELSQPGKAAENFNRALLLAPELPVLHCNLGLSLMELGDNDGAQSHFHTALKINPSQGSAWNGLGLLMLSKRLYAEALDYFDRACAVSGNDLNALNNKGLALGKLNRHQEALACFTAAVNKNPHLVESYINMGNELLDLGRISDAIAALQRAEQLSPGNEQALNGIGLALLAQKKPNEALDCFNRALQTNPASIEALNNKGLTLRKAGQLHQAEQCYKNILNLDDAHPEAFSNLANVLQDQGRISEACNTFRKALQLKPYFPKAHSNLLLCLNYAGDSAQEEIYRESLNWGSRYCPTEKDSTFQHPDLSNRRLRIGYVSPDFRQHSVSYFFIPLLEAHDRTKVEVFCYAEVKSPDGVSARIQKSADHWCSTVGMSDTDLAAKIRTDGIDILVDLGGHTAHSRLSVFGHQPAPVQVAWLGYPNTTGVQHIKYRISDPIADPEGVDSYYSEKLVRLTDGFLCFLPPQDSPAIDILPYEKHRKITFGSFNNLPKINEQVVQVWAKILSQVPNAELILKSNSLGDKQVCERYRVLFHNHGISGKRLHFYGRLPDVNDHLNLYNSIDIGLDPFPYNGTTTTFEALWMGVPVLTLKGQWHAGRVGASIMTQIGHTDLITTDINDYIGKAIHLARHPAELQVFRQNIRNKLLASSACDSKRFAETMENTFKQLLEPFEPEGEHSNIPTEMKPAPTEADPLETRSPLPKYIFCSGMPRSGSTWSYNVCRLLAQSFAEGRPVNATYAGEGAALTEYLKNTLSTADDAVHVIKFHYPTPEILELIQNGEAVNICTMRNPLDALASLKEKFQTNAQQGIESLKRFLEASDHLRAESDTMFIPFEEILETPAPLIQQIALKMGVKPEKSLVEKIDASTSYEKSKEVSDSLNDSDNLVKAGSSSYDPVTLLHKKHILKGKDRNWRTELSTSEQLAAIEELNKWIPPHELIRPDKPEIDSDDILQQINSFPFWYHKIKLPQGTTTPGWAPLNPDAYRIPADLTGKRILDIGAWDGYWTFEALKRGAEEVVAIDDFSDYLGTLETRDRKAWETFDFCKRQFGFPESRCKRYEISVYDLTPDTFGTFDLIFFFGTLYHLRYPLLALDKLAAICKEGIHIETAVADDFSPYKGGLGNGYNGNHMIMEFYPEKEYGSNNSNWWCPTLLCLLHMMKAAGFKECEGWKLTDSPQKLPHCRGFARGVK